MALGLLMDVVCVICRFPSKSRVGDRIVEVDRYTIVIDWWLSAVQIWSHDHIGVSLGVIQSPIRFGGLVAG